MRINKTNNIKGKTYFPSKLKNINIKLATLGTLTFIGVSSLFLLNKMETHAKEIIEINNEIDYKYKKVMYDNGETEIIKVLNDSKDNNNYTVVEEDVELVDSYSDDYDVAYAISEYSEIFNLDPNKVYRKAKEVTEGFQSEEFKKNYIIEGSRIPKGADTLDSIDEGVILYLKTMAENPEKFGLEEKYVTNNKHYKFEGNFEMMVETYCDILNYNPIPVIAIAYTECGSDLNSSAFQTRNNSHGILTSNGEVKEFDNVVISSIEAIENLKWNYKSFNPNNISNWVESVGSKYCTEGTDNWKNNVVSYANDVKNRVSDKYNRL